MLEPQQLTGGQRRFLRALAHPLKPIVQLGRSGLTAGVLSELGRALETHELVKVKVSPECPEEPAELAAPIETALAAHVAQVIGRVLVVYRAREKDPTIELPQPSKKRGSKPAAAAKK